ncbi:hydroxyacylglutathione hydrolase [Marinomonas pollencensis]|uniref:Hydroxyacylglutathione hydrolase n=1 Tax=Marinomonas pollencensis TaxID=491954 RepID=A0A3E0DVG0_9GAMM|nr:hydroxyacylglutathione hydrolase [Marinomonas pollencensis]REG86514.1 hydroxyacylglutathione hydrolase [Marinomonas pollencensis]
MTFIPLHAFSDNYIWIIHEKDSSLIWAVDPGDANVVSQYCDTHDLELAGILITHHHQDHTGGVAQLKAHYQCQVYGPAHLAPMVTHPLQEGDTVTVFSRSFRVLETPGHTLDHLCYFSDQDTPVLFSGDTLFRGGCGRIMEGTPEQMLAAMNKLAALPDNTLVYCTHEYTLANYRFALHLDQQNKALLAAQQDSQQARQQKQVTLPSSMGLEKQTNPFLRSHIPALVSQAAQQLNEAAATNQVDAFSQVRRAKDTFS